jgi:hypothetical protein
MAWSPTGAKASQPPSAKPGFSSTPSSVTLQIGARQANPVDAARRRRAGLSKRLADARLPAVIGRKGKTGCCG